jgi:hypothetical protein
MLLIKFSAIVMGLLEVENISLLIFINSSLERIFSVAKLLLSRIMVRSKSVIN